MFAPGRKLPARPAKPGDTNSARRAAALQTSQMGQSEEQGFFPAPQTVEISLMLEKVAFLAPFRRSQRS